MSGRGYRKEGQRSAYCTYCNMPGHTVDRCYKKHGYPPGYKPKGQINYVKNELSDVQQIGAMN